MSDVSSKSRLHATASLWHATSPQPPARPELRENVVADVAVIGGGITGLTAAMHLQAAGKRVVVLEAGRVGGGTTGDTSGHLEALPDQGVTKLIKDFGQPAARAGTLARMAAIEQIERWCREMTIDCAFRRVPAYAYSESPEGAAELQALCEQLHGLRLQAAITDDVGLPFARGGVRIENQARFHSQKYVEGLATELDRSGTLIYEHTQAQPPSDGDPCVVACTTGGRVSARDVLLCTHSCYLGISQIDLRMAPYQSYVLTARVSDEVPDALFWDDAQPYHYIRLASDDDRRLLVIGGADHKTGQGGDERAALEKLEQYARGRFAIESIEHCWSAEFFEPSDGLPYAGRVPLSDHLYLATGFSGTGLTFGTLSGRLLADLVLERQSPLAQILSPSRIKPKAAATNFLTENLNVAKHFVADRFTADRIDSLDEVRPGEGRLVRLDGKQWSVYRDPQGTVHVFSPTCTHAGCHVQWNEFESTWDCPCHGGRFNAKGERIYGPPTTDLKRKPPAEL